MLGVERGVTTPPRKKFLVTKPHMKKIREVAKVRQ
jgi:hypothetical protein